MNSAELKKVPYEKYEMILILLNLKSFGAKIRNFYSSVINLFFLECDFVRSIRNLLALKVTVEGLILKL